MSVRRRRRREPTEKHWDFLSFPVYFAFAAGMLLATLLYPLGLFVFVIALFGTSFGIVHIISNWFQQRVIEKRRQKLEEEERERRALAARSAAALENEQASRRRRRRRNA